MNWNNSTLLRRVRAAPEHLADLSERFREMAGQVRSAVAEAVGSAASGLVRDGLHHLWKSEPPAPVRPPASTSSSRWADDFDVWGDDRDADEYPVGRSPRPAPRPEVAAPPAEISVPCLVALALRAAGWWLQRRGSWPLAALAGVGVAGLAALGGPAALAVLGLLEAAVELAALDSLLSEGGRLLTA